MHRKLKSSKRSLQALLGMRDGLLSLTPPCCKSHLWCAAREKKTCLLQVFGSVRGEKILWLVLAIGGSDFAPTPPSWWGPCWDSSLYLCLALGLAFLSTALSVPGPELGMLLDLFWGGSCGTTRAGRGWKSECCGERNKLLSTTSCEKSAPLLWKICSLGPILPLPTSAGAWSLI